MSQQLNVRRSSTQHFSGSPNDDLVLRPEGQSHRQPPSLGQQGSFTSKHSLGTPDYQQSFANPTEFAPPLSQHGTNGNLSPFHQQHFSPLPSQHGTNLPHHGCPPQYGTNLFHPSPYHLPPPQVTEWNRCHPSPYLVYPAFMLPSGPPPFHQQHFVPPPSQHGTNGNMYHYQGSGYQVSTSLHFYLTSREEDRNDMVTRCRQESLLFFHVSRKENRKDMVRRILHRRSQRHGRYTRSKSLRRSLW
mmetsp:Transcript_35684/g.39725  ORF Transcript_35684/g.39725 Transcript_35684/m.39725 type:complete len:245 (-) Transcript_35684:194-928(-)